MSFNEVLNFLPTCWSLLFYNQEKLWFNIKQNNIETTLLAMKLS